MRDRRTITMLADGKAIDLPIDEYRFRPFPVIEAIEHGRAQLQRAGATGTIRFAYVGAVFDHPDPLLDHLFPGSFMTWRDRLAWD